MGAVYRARHTLTGRAVALKWMIPDPDADAASVQRFLREARAMGRIDHPNVVGVLDVGVSSSSDADQRSAFLVMELLRGASLRAYVERETKLAPSEAVALLLPALEGVAAAHRAGVVHRDLKPENLFVVQSEDGRAITTKVLDFGISKLHEHAHASAPQPSITQTGTTMGTPSYMSPEQVRGARDVDARTDVWALGAILYEMVTGRVPFRAETYGALMVAIVMDPLVPADVIAPDLPRELARVIDRALEKDPEQRIASVEALRDAIAPFAGELAGAKVASSAEIGIKPTTPAPKALAPRASVTPTRPARPDSARPPEGAAEIQLDSAAMRAPAANASVPLSVPDLPVRARGRSTSRAMVVGLAIAIVVPLAAVVLHAMTRTSAPTESPTRAAATTPAPIAPAPPAPSIETAAPDAGIAALEPQAVEPAPASDPIAVEPEPPVRPTRHRGGHATRSTTARPEPPAATTTTPPTPPRSTSGRTGSLSRDEF
ncbi:Serine/threonine protein kinase PrkC, regulator of stationary phase [Sandaracinus amylolyticus]|uniref:Serine/threonine protein kinase PrkC, regulator of stationary phase n=2 Tax=Sandaracinus amylolyticus TaxID=927083 RepID=A0A0F6W892_9BACT|nr:Serine/threonine protein kinase PrkC, regulator of stationary phase [Sandaracinus amylolyticus]